MVGRSKQIRQIYHEMPIKIYLFVNGVHIIIDPPMDLQYRWLAIMGMYDTLNMISGLRAEYER